MPNIFSRKYPTFIPESLGNFLEIKIFICHDRQPAQEAP
jgi:hypothetical protein